MLIAPGQLFDMLDCFLPHFLLVVRLVLNNDKAHSGQRGARIMCRPRASRQHTTAERGIPCAHRARHKYSNDLTLVLRSNTRRAHHTFSFAELG